ncbi:MAG: UTP--glucose-1-phosphate uridylyltransferase [Pirellulaceae bacterium]
MIKPVSRELWELLSQCGQEHLVAFWDHLDPTQQQQLESQLHAIDLAEINRLYQQATTVEQAAIDWSQARPPPVIQVASKDETRQPARQLGVEALRANQTAVVLVAGGQGSRLGFEKPKGLFPIGSISKRSLLQVLMHRITAIASRYDSCIPLYIMTSPQTDQPIREFLDQHHYFGMDPAQVKLFCQDVMPAVDQQTGRILMQAPGSLALSPNGHGGMLMAFARHGCLDDALQRNVKYLFYGQIDNPLLPICDPRLIGNHVLADSEMSTHMIRKSSAEEMTGIAVLTGDQLRLVEYNHVPTAIATQTDAEEELIFWAGSMGTHVFSTNLLSRAASLTNILPYHASSKNVPCLDSTGTLVTAETTNAYKFERFIFELATVAENPILVEVDRQESFAPVKNSSTDGMDTPETARRIMSNLYRSWLTAAGITVAPDVEIEIDPRWALDQAEVAAKLTEATTIDSATYFHP